jgi:hypothetical protein
MFDIGGRNSIADAPLRRAHTSHPAPAAVRRNPRGPHLATCRLAPPRLPLTQGRLGGLRPGCLPGPDHRATAGGIGWPGASCLARDDRCEVPILDCERRLCTMLQQLNARGEDRPGREMSSSPWIGRRSHGGLATRAAAFAFTSRAHRWPTPSPPAARPKVVDSTPHRRLSGRARRGAHPHRHARAEARC